MVTLHSRLTPKREEVAAKVIDGEAIIINLVNGSYYSLDDVGAVVWGLIEDGLTLEQIIASVASSYDIEEETAQGDIETLGGRLLEEDLVSLDSEDSSSAAPTRAQPGDRLPYSTPELVKYTDMADLLALDPPMPGLAENPWLENADDR